MDYKTRAIEMFANDRYAMGQTGIEIVEVGEHRAKCRIKIEDKHLNVHNNVMGGAIFTLADFTFGVAANTPVSGCVSLSSSINFVSPARGSVLTAEARCIREGRTICFYNVVLTDDSDRVVAEAQFNGFRSTR